MSKISDAIKALIALNVIVFAVTFFVPGMEEKMFTWLALYFPTSPNFQLWQFVSSMFMHGGFMHILLNMYGLWAFGSPLEVIWGKGRFLFFYFASGIGAGAIYILVNYVQFTMIQSDLAALGVSSAELHTALTTGNFSADVTVASESVEQVKTLVQQAASFFYASAVGASGALYGVLAAFGMLFPNAKLALIFLPVPIPAKYFIPVLIGIDLFSGVTGFSIFGGNVAHFAHVGGALIGFLLVWYWKKKGTLIPAEYIRSQMDQYREQRNDTPT